MDFFKKFKEKMNESSSKDTLTLDEIKEILKHQVDDFIYGLTNNVDEEGNFPEGEGIDYKNEDELISDFILFLQISNK